MPRRVAALVLAVAAAPAAAFAAPTDGDPERERLRATLRAIVLPDIAGPRHGAAAWRQYEVEEEPAPPETGDGGPRRSP